MKIRKSEYAILIFIIYILEPTSLNIIDAL